MNKTVLTALLAGVLVVLSFGLVGAPAGALVGTSTTLTIAPTTVNYGNETSVLFSASVDDTFATGMIQIFQGSSNTATCTIMPLVNGGGSCYLGGDTALDASSTPYSFTAVYSGNDLDNGSTSSPENLTVDQAPTTTTVQSSSPTVTYGQESTLTFTSSVSPQPTGSPLGTIDVDAGATALCTITLPATSCGTSDDPLAAGDYNVTATYSGNTDFGSSSSSPEDLTVNWATPSSPAIANLPSAATEEGSFTADVVTSGDGTPSVTSDTPANCTVGSDGLTVEFDVEGQCTLTPHVTSGRGYAAASGNPQTFTIAPGPRGYWLVGSDGGIFSFGAAQFHGSMGGTPLQRPVVGITPTSSRNGYWLVASDGGIFAFGDAGFFGSIPGLGLHPAGSAFAHRLAAPIVGMVPSHDGGGYFMVASDGGVFAFGDAKFAGSCPGIGGCAGAAVAVMPDASGNGYWLVTSTGAVYAFGDAPFFGAPARQSVPVVSAVATPDGGGYWLLYANGPVVNFGDAGPYGDPVGYVNQFNPATAIFPTTDGLGYWVASAKGDVFSFGNAPFLGSVSATHLNGPIIAAFGF